MKKLLIAGAALAALIGTPALAADLAYKVPSPPPPAWSWTGFYLGGNIGYSVGRDPTNQNINGLLGGAAAGSTLITTDDLSPSGFLGGGQIGYNLQMAPQWLIGIEADFQGADQRGSSCSFECGVLSLTVQQKLDWFGTVRARMGYVNGDYLWYVTGGGAYANVQNIDALSASVAVGAGAGGTLGALNMSTDRGGWVVGGGVETHLSANWTAKVEALYMDLGQITNTYALGAAIIAGAASVTVSSNIRDYIFRTGLNYKF